MATSSTATPETSFEFNCYKFNGNGARPTPVTSIADAQFIRSRQSVDGTLIEIAKQRVQQWCQQRGISVTMLQPYPSNAPGKFWLEFRFGGLVL